VVKKLFSMKVATLLLFLFGIIIGVATFIENDYGTQTAKALVYNAQWFEYFLLYFILLLVYNIVKYKSYKKKMSVFIFHIAFLIIALGAVITRYIGYEGIMSIREGQSSSSMVSDVKVLQIDIKSGTKSEHFEQSLLLSSMTQNSFTHNMNIEEKKVNFELTNYLPTAQKKLKADVNGKKLLELMVSNGRSKGKLVRIFKGDFYDAGSFIITFNYTFKSTDNRPIFEINEKDGKLELINSFPVHTLSMLTRQEENLTQGVNHFEMKKLYQFSNNSIVLKKRIEKSVMHYRSTSLKTKGGIPEMVTLKVSVGDKSQEVNLFSYAGNRGRDKKIDLDGVEITLNLGAKVIELPFALKLIDFELERYPGSMSPASYASEVELTDREEGIKAMPFRIYMNHVLDHRNYRFFQSSYDADEKGTVLSVNHDPGTLPTYLGYLLLTLGMIWNLFDKNGRFQKLLRGARKLQSTSLAFTIMLFLGYTSPLQSASLPTLDDNATKIVKAYEKETLRKFGSLILQSHAGRMKPMDTFAHEIVSKLSGKTSIYGVEPSAILLGMTVNPQFYQNLKIIKIGHKQIALDLGLNIDSKYASFNDFFSEAGEYKLVKQISESVRKKPLEKSAYDKELVKSDERLNISYMVYTGSLLRIYPTPHDANNKWVNPQDAIAKFPKEISKMVRMMTLYLFEGTAQIQKDGNTTQFNQAINLVKLYQQKFGSKVLPSDTEISIEMKYNQLGLLSKLVPLYLLVGIILLFASFINVVRPLSSLKLIVKISWILMIVGFGLHLAGMGMRWYVGGHAPWSNAYESIVFIAGSTVVAGLVFAKKSPFTLGATALLAGVTMGVAHMSFVNPEITNLVPVLKSYWLMIHVATIISGDGFLGLGSILSLLVLILFIMRKEGEENIDRSIKELTNIAEMSLIVGLFLMTIGNFLGGVWANESWGRYWGWDSKETWAAVTILIYASVLHLRFISKFNNPFVFNVASLWAYSSVLMTYFGVNYYLSGLHSYAAGAPIPIPNWVPYSIIALMVLTLLAYRNRKLK
jgi:cytochrome c-type biogenesis protein CcsB